MMGPFKRKEEPVTVGGVEVGSLVNSYLLRVDLGQAQDYTALCVIEHGMARWELANNILQARYLAPNEQVYNVVHLERMPLGTSYSDVTDLVKRRWEGLPQPDKGHTVHGNNWLVVDNTGVGRAVVDMMRQARLVPYPITITSAKQPSHQGGSWHVPKQDLVALLQTLLQTGRLRVAGGLRDGKTLVREMKNLTYKITSAANVTYEAWRENEHDDLVLSVAVACWWADRIGVQRYA